MLFHHRDLPIIVQGEYHCVTEGGGRGGEGRGKERKGGGRRGREGEGEEREEGGRRGREEGEEEERTGGASFMVET